MTLISVIIPFHNEISLINQAVYSVLSQDSLLVREIIIVNDGFLENSVIYHQIPIECRGNIPIRVISNSSYKGPGGARNTGIELSTGDIIAFLDADDIWHANKLRCQYELLLSEGSSFVAGAYQYAGQVTVVNPPRTIRSEIELLTKQGIGTSTVLIKKDLIDKTRFSSRRFCQDIEFWCNLAKKDQFRFSATESVVSIYSPDGSSRNKFVQLSYFLGFLTSRRLNPLRLFLILLIYVSRGLSRYMRQTFAP